MTIQIDTPIFPAGHDTPTAGSTGDPDAVFIGGRAAATGYSYAQPLTEVAPEFPVVEDRLERQSHEVNIFAPQVGLRNKLSSFRARRRLNHSFRRNQAGFENAMDNVAHDPAAQRELQTSWTLGR